MEVIGIRSAENSVDLELDRLINRRASQDRRPDPDEREELWKAGVRAHNARREEEQRLARLAYHEGQALRLSSTLADLVAFHKAEAEKYLPKGAA
jgi:hypothetical protein